MCRAHEDLSASTMSRDVVVEYESFRVPTGSECCFSTWPIGDCDVKSHVTRTHSCDLPDFAETGPVYLRVGEGAPVLMQNETTLVFETEAIRSFLKTNGDCFVETTVVQTATSYVAMFLALLAGFLLTFVFLRVMEHVKSKRSQTYVRHADRSDV